MPGSRIQDDLAATGVMGPALLFLLIDQAPAIRELALTTAWLPSEH
jgi:hypothetical protein